MNVLRGSLREFGVLLNVMTGGVPDGDADRRQPRRGPVWIAVQVVALAVLGAALIVVSDLFFDTPEPGTVATSAAWFLPGFLLALPLALHWFARPERRVLGLAAAVVAGAVAGAAFAPLVAGWGALWPGLVTLTVAMLVAAAVFGAVAPVPGTDDTGPH